VQRRATEEEGFGLIELLFAMVMLNIGILTLVAAFQTGAVALTRSSSVSNGAAVADKVMEVYRGLKSCQIYLTAPTGGGADSGTPAVPSGIPNNTSSWYTRYSTDTQAYGGPTIAMFAYNTSTPQWVTSNTAYSTTNYSGIPATCAAPTGLPSGSPDPTKAVQYISGPDGQSYPVFTYIVVVQPSGASWTAGYVKQVTVSVLNPQSTSKILARETSYFDPNVTG
jgi:type II secretory pathway pseudopilin PulG